MKPELRDRFDLLLSDAVESLPPALRELLDEVPVIVQDRPSAELVRSLRQDGTLASDEDASELCGLHTGTALTSRSVEDHARMPDQVYLFREGIVSLAGGWHGENAEEKVYEEIRTTLLHELGHHFGLDEDDLEDLGYA